MKILKEFNREEQVISLAEAEIRVEKKINNTTRDTLYVVKYKGDLVSFSGDYYKFAYKRLSYLRNALSHKFGKELADALVKEKVIEIYKIYV